MLMEGHRLGCLPQTSVRAALLSERSILVSGPGRNPDKNARETDFGLLEEGLAKARSCDFDYRTCLAAGLHASSCRQVEATRKLYLRAARRTLGPAPTRTPADPREPDDPVRTARWLLAAFPDRVAARTQLDSPLFRLTGGRAARLAPGSALDDARLVVAAEMGESTAGDKKTTRLSLAERLEVAWLEDCFPGHVTRKEQMVWNHSGKAVERLELTLFQDLVVEEKRLPPGDPARAAAILAQHVRKGELTLNKWTPTVDRWLDRVRCVADWFPDRGLLTYDEEDLLLLVEELCTGYTRYSQIKDLPCLDTVKNAMNWSDQQFVARMAPERIGLPGGCRMKIIYCPGQRPRARTRIQDLYDLEETPTVAGGRQRLLLEILAPNFRTVQTTDDLAGFWKNHYPALRKQYARRYPRHEWR